MRFVLFVSLVILAAPVGVLGYEILDVFVRPDRFAPMFGLATEFDAPARIGAAAMMGAFLALIVWSLRPRGQTRQLTVPAVTSTTDEARLIRAERDYWCEVVTGLLAAQHVSDEERDRLLSTIRTSLEAQVKNSADGDQKRTLVAQR